MKKAILICAFLSGVVTAMSQFNKATGKVSYEIVAPQGIRHLDMWFTNQKYVYQYKMPDISQSPIFRNKKYQTLEDSIADVKRMNEIREDMKKDPVQYWYGELRTDEVIYSSFDNNHKTYCVKDTISVITWELAQDTAMVNGLSCQKAKGQYRGINYEAWFAPSIPVSVAPLQFRGLPGLLIKVTNLSTKVFVNMTDLEWPVKATVTLQPCSNSPLISKQELAVIVQKQNADLFLRKQATEQKLKGKN